MIIDVFISAGQQSSPPQFLTHPSNVTAFRSTTLPCAASGTPTPTITWLRDGSPLDVTTTPGLTKTATGLQISGLQDDGGEGLEGEYQCVATNQLGAVRSQPAMVTRTGTQLMGREWHGVGYREVVWDFVKEKFPKRNIVENSIPRLIASSELNSKCKGCSDFKNIIGATPLTTWLCGHLGDGVRGREI